MLDWIKKIGSKESEEREPMTFVVSRDPKRDIFFHDRSISREHAEIRMEKGQFFIRDCQSANLTFVNGMRIGGEWVAIRRGDVLRFGKFSCCFQQTHEEYPSLLIDEKGSVAYMNKE